MPETDEQFEFDFEFHEHKTCTKCGQSKPLTEFRVRSEAKALAKFALQDMKKNTKDDLKLKRRLEKIKNTDNKKNQIRLIKIKEESGCIDCGETDYRVLDFDHIDPSTKLYNVSRMLTCSQKKIDEEIAKCVVRCANCHRKKTADENGHYDYIE